MLRLSALLIVSQAIAAVLAQQPHSAVLKATLTQAAAPSLKTEEVAEIPPPFKPNTTTSTTTTTTTTTTAAPPKPHQPQFSVKDKVSGVTCLLANLTATVKVSWNNTLNNTRAQRSIPFNVTTAYEDERTSHCYAFLNQTDLGLTNFAERDSTLLLTFSNTSTTQYGLTNVTLGLNLDPVHYDGIDSRVRGMRTVKNSGDLKLWQTSFRQYYSCMTNGDTVRFAVYNISDEVLKLEVEFESVQVEALMTRQDNGVWGKESLCRMDRVTNEIVPIVVGCALAALVIIVLVAYLIGRRRSRARGYESM